MPDPANPQSFNRFSYVRNSPVSRIDPSGHVDCDFETGVCTPPDNTVVTQPEPTLVLFEAEGGEQWNQAEMDTIEAAAWATAERYADAYNQRILAQRKRAAAAGESVDSWRTISPAEAFLRIHDGPVTFKRVSDSCSNCWGETISDNLIHVYSNASANNVSQSPNFIVHELAHAFENALLRTTGSKLGRGTLADKRSDGNWIPRLEGFAGEYGGLNAWIQSPVNSAGEEFADMGIGWVYNSWDKSPRGDRRAAFMNSHMPGWVSLIVNSH